MLTGCPPPPTSQPLHPRLQVFERLTESYAFTHLFTHLQMDSQPSSSSGAMDQCRKDALKVYREVSLLIPFACKLYWLLVYRKWEVMKQAARVWRTVRQPFFFFLEKHIPIIFVVRFSLKDLKKEYSKTEDDIKAVQSVGQIVGEVVKQLDADRCE